MIESIMRKFSRPIALWLSKSPVTPNEITILRVLIFASFSAVFFAIGQYITNIIAIIFCLLCALFDYVDGDLARLKSKESKIGEWLDHVLADWIVGNVILSGIFFGVSNSGYNRTIILAVGISSIFAYNMTKFLTNQFEQKCNLWWGHIDSKIEHKFSLVQSVSTLDQLHKNIVFPRFPISVFFMIGFPIVFGGLCNQMFFALLLISLTFNIRWVFMFYIFCCLLRENKIDSPLLVKFLQEIQ